MTRLAYQYVVLRCVPRPDREEFHNVGVVLYCEEASFLDVACQVDEERLTALDPRLDLAQVRAGLEHAAAVCAGDTRAPRSTVLQTGPVHGGLTADPARQLEHLLERLVG